MLEFIQNAGNSGYYPFSSLYSKEAILFFDIETTGLSPDISSLYLIGCAFYDHDGFKTIQWFADDYRSEEELLNHFFQFLSSYKLLVHYNGSGFDIPYLLKKCAQFHLSYDFQSIESLDIYKEIKPYKKLFCLPNLKQKTMEQYLSKNRKDIYDGGQLISVYGDFLKCKFMRKEEEKESCLSLLLLHNREDVEGLLALTAFLSIKELFQNPLKASHGRLMDSMLHITIEKELPLSFHYEANGFILETQNTCVILRVPVYFKVLKYFYENYKDYYYLPKEDAAIHKSVAAYVDGAYKEKAKASTCYTKKEGNFIPQLGTCFSPCLKESHKDKYGFLEVTGELLKDNEFLSCYASHILNKILSLK